MSSTALFTIGLALWLWFSRSCLSCLLDCENLQSREHILFIYLSLYLFSSIAPYMLVASKNLLIWIVLEWRTCNYSKRWTWLSHSWFEDQEFIYLLWCLAHSRCLVNINQVQPKHVCIFLYLPLARFDWPKCKWEAAEFRSEKVRRS